jgi:hypothetical protein
MNPTSKRKISLALIILASSSCGKAINGLLTKAAFDDVHEEGNESPTPNINEDPGNFHFAKNCDEIANLINLQQSIDPTDQASQPIPSLNRPSASPSEPSKQHEPDVEESFPSIQSNQFIFFASGSQVITYDAETQSVRFRFQLQVPPSAQVSLLLRKQHLVAIYQSQGIESPIVTVVGLMIADSGQLEKSWSKNLDAQILMRSYLHESKLLVETRSSFQRYLNPSFMPQEPLCQNILIPRLDSIEKPNNSRTSFISTNKFASQLYGIYTLDLDAIDPPAKSIGIFDPQYSAVTYAHPSRIFTTIQSQMSKGTVSSQIFANDWNLNQADLSQSKFEGTVSSQRQIKFNSEKNKLFVVSHIPAGCFEDESNPGVYRNTASSSQVAVFDTTSHAIQPFSKSEPFGLSEQLLSFAFRKNQILASTGVNADPLHLISIADPKSPHQTSELVVPELNSHIYFTDDSHFVSFGNFDRDEYRVTSGHVDPNEHLLVDQTYKSNPSSPSRVSALTNWLTPYISDNGELVGFPLSIPGQGGDTWQFLRRASVLLQPLVGQSNSDETNIFPPSTQPIATKMHSS